MQADGQDATPHTPSAFSQLSTLNPQPPDIPDHELLCLIGRGSYGEVWLARNAIGTLRAVKIVHRQSFQRAEHFEREFKGLLKFEPISRSHDGLVDILQIGRRDDEGYFFYVMELADDAEAERSDGVVEQQSNAKAQPSQHSKTPTLQYSSSYAPLTLRSLIRPAPQPSTLNPQPGNSRLPPAECVTLGLKLAAALQHLHMNGLVHRDIKPSNIIFVNGEPKLADIGLVTAIDEAQSLVGTVGYIPPEGPGTPQADLYSLGKVLYEIALGKDRQDFPQLPPDLQSHPDYAALLELNEVILKACETDARRRYASATALSNDLALLQRGQSVKRQRLWSRRWAIAGRLGFGAIAVALLVMALPFLSGRMHEHTPTPDALQLYKEGQWQYSQLTPEAHIKALTKLSEAVEKDPKFIKPYAELTALYTWNNLPSITNEQIRLQKVKEIADKALAIDPEAAETHLALSWCRFLERDWRSAEAEIQRAIQRNPNLALAHDFYCFYLSMQGRSADAHREGQRATEGEAPNSQRASAIIASWPYTTERRFDLAIAQLQRVLELDPNFAGGHSYLGDCYEAQSNYVAAIREYRTAYLLTAKDTTKVNVVFDALRKAYNTSGEQGYLRKWIELILADEDLPETDRLLVEIDHGDLAGYYARLGEKAKALESLEKHFGDPQVWHQIKFLPMYDPLHDEPRFKALVKRAGLEP